MQKSFEPTHLKITTAFDQLVALCAFLRTSVKLIPTRKETRKDIWARESVVETWERILEETEAETIGLQDRYMDLTSPLLHTDDISGDYYKILSSENILNKMGVHYVHICDIVKGMEKGYKKILGESFCVTVKNYMGVYSANLPDPPKVPPKETRFCPQCSGDLFLCAESSEMQCFACGFTEELTGTLFEDNQCYTQQITYNKHKRHDPNIHCTKWLHQIQAKENKVFPEKILALLNAKAVKEYTQGGRKKSMANLTCRQVRKWLKQTRLAKYNNHAPLLRKLISGMNGEPVGPPQLTSEEELFVLTEFRKINKVIMKLSKKDAVLSVLNKDNIKNNPYYPFVIYKILLKLLHKDPRKDRLIECIHFQGKDTMIKNDKLWRIICNNIPGYTYESTTKTSIIEIY